MHNSNHPIDQQMREVLEQGSERLNLGAWANMERMLDGQNPYAEPEEEKKKRGFWLFGVLALAIVLIGATVYQVLHSSKKNEPVFANQLTTDQVIKSKLAPKIKNAATVNDASDNDPNAINAVQTSQNQTEVLATNNQTNQVDKQPQQPNQKAGITIINKKENKNKQLVVSTKTNELLINNSEPQTSNVDLPTKEANDIANAEKIKLAEQVKTNKIPEKAAIQLAKAEQLKAAAIEIAKQKQAKEIAKAEKATAKQAEKLKKLEEKQIAQANKRIANEAAKVLKQQQTDAKALAKAKKAELANIASIEMNEKPKDSITLIKKLIGRKKNEDGVVQTKENITISKVENTNTKEIAKNAEPEETPIEKTNVVVENKRFVQLNAEDDKKASAKPSKVSLAKKATVTLQEPTGIVADVTTPVLKPELKPVVKAKANANQQSNWVRKVLDRMAETTQKLGYLPIFNQKIVVNPAIFAGINGSFFTKEANYGGFQAGTNLMMQISKNFSLLPHLGFYYRNNGGYSVKDFSTDITNRSSYISTDQKNKIFNYTQDSNAITYNFKQIFSIEAPILLQYHRKDFTFYGGVNIAYGFKINPSVKTNTYARDVSTTISIDSVYNAPVSQSTYYKSTDFQSRFGLGYVAGFSYDFHPNLYFDARLTQNLWDNSGTASAITMSNKMFRMPSLQLGIAYRFKEKERARY
jgi:hypothetical protein